jgi:hypothetical protein
LIGADGSYVHQTLFSHEATVVTTHQEMQQR